MIRSVATLCLLCGSVALGDRVIKVAADGSGDFTSPQAAVDSVADGGSEPTIIEIAPGTYKQHLVIPKGKNGITLRGTTSENTILTDDKNVNSTHADGKKMNSREYSSTLVQADNFAAENITFENTAGNHGQAMAIFLSGDRSVFKSCRFIGWQDTVRLNNGRSYFVDCYIEGHVDFIYGSGISWLENCKIHCVADGYITAASTPENEPIGYVFNNCLVTAAPTVKRTYLGRPWRPFASVVFKHCTLPAAIDPAGWNNWGKVENEKTARYAEYKCGGPGANRDARAPWSRELTDDEARKLTVERVLAGTDQWKPR